LDRPEYPLAASVFLGCFSFDETVLLHFFQEFVGDGFGDLFCGLSVLCFYLPPSPMDLETEAEREKEERTYLPMQIRTNIRSTIRSILLLQILQDQLLCFLTRNRLNFLLATILLPSITLFLLLLDLNLLHSFWLFSFDLLFLGLSNLCLFALDFLDFCFFSFGLEGGGCCGGVEVVVEFLAGCHDDSMRGRRCVC
jgi:hypothetical protein